MNSQIKTEELIAEAEELIRIPKSSRETLDQRIESDMFIPTGKKLGQGSWGVVEEYTDVAGKQKWAIKRFSPDERAVEKMKQRNLTEDGVMLSEAIPLSAAAFNVAPRIISRDKTGKMFVAMPVYSGSLAEKTSRGSLPEKEAIRYISRLGEAAGYFHTVERKAHGDIKLDNVLLDSKDNLFLADLGSSTCISMSSRSEDSRSGVGARAYRAPECYKDDSHPDSRSDVFSLGAVALELLTGEKVYQGIDPENCDPKKLADHIKSKTKNVPKKLRKTISKALSVDPLSRQSDGRMFKEELEQEVKRYNEGNSLIGALKTAVKVGLPAAMLGFAAYSAATHEPTKLDMPSIQPRVSGMLYKPGESKQENIVFDSERILNLPTVSNYRGSMLDGQERVAKLATDNRVVAYLTKTHGQAAMFAGSYNAEPASENQYRLFTSNTHDSERSYLLQGAAGPVIPVVAKSIEVALALGENGKGQVDLEDVMAISRVGIKQVMEAKRSSGSENYAAYRNALNEKGERIIPESEAKFVDNWLAFYHSDI